MIENHVFTVYGANNDGVVDFTEFMVVYHIMSQAGETSGGSEIFCVFEMNSDGTISMKEMNELIKDMHGLRKTEDPNAATKDIIAKTAFAKMDSNGDGCVCLKLYKTG